MKWEDFFYIEETHRNWTARGTYYHIYKVDSKKRVSGRTYYTKDEALVAVKSMFTNILHDIEKDLGLR